MSEISGQIEKLEKYKEQVRKDKSIVPELLNFFTNCIKEACNNDYDLSSQGIKNLEELIKKFDHEELIEAIEISFAQYYKGDNEDEKSDAFNKAFNYISRIAINRKKEKENPDLAKRNHNINYCKKILANNLRYVNDAYAKDWLNKLLDDYTFESVSDMCKKAKSWTHFRTTAESWLED